MLRDLQGHLDTWVVRVPGGEPQRCL